MCVGDIDVVADLDYPPTAHDVEVCAVQYCACVLTLCCQIHSYFTRVGGSSFEVEHDILQRGNCGRVPAR